MNVAEKICICEIFGPTIQGEGACIGRPTIFVRTGGCDYRCRWCDTLYAVERRYLIDWTEMSAEEILVKVHALSGGHPLMVSLSGGNPALQPLGGLLALGKASGYCFALETQGSVAQKWFAELDVLTLSPKPPSSGMPTNLPKLHDCVAAGAGRAATSLKFVIFDEADYLYARGVAGSFAHLPVYLQPCNFTPPDSGGELPADEKTVNSRMLWLVERVLADAWFAARVLPQLHVMLWGDRRWV